MALHAAVKQALQTPWPACSPEAGWSTSTSSDPTSVAVVSCTKQISDERAEASKTDGSAPGELPNAGILTYVVVKEQDDWRIALAQTTPVRV